PISEKTKAFEYLQNGSEIAQKSNTMFLNFAAKLNLAQVYFWVKGDCRKSSEFYLEGIDWAGKVGHLEYATAIKSELAWIYLIMGEWDKATQIADELLASFARLGSRAKEYTLGVVGNLHLLHGELDESEERLKAVLSVTRG